MFTRLIQRLPINRLTPASRSNSIVRIKRTNPFGSYSSIQAHMSTTHTPMRENSFFPVDKKLTKLIKQFKDEIPLATEEDIQQFIEDYHVIPKENFFLSGKLEYIHKKSILLRMLQTPWDMLDKLNIDKTLEQLGFKIRQEIFQETVQLHLARRGGGLYSFY